MVSIVSKTLTDQEIIINSVEDFFKMKDNRNGKFALGQDIDFNNEPFNSPFNTSSLAFGGTFDGKGFALKNITFEKNSHVYRCIWICIIRCY